MREHLSRKEALEHLEIIEESTFYILRSLYTKKFEIENDIKIAKDLLDQIEREKRRLIEI